jgi:hypothetical protein
VPNVPLPVIQRTLFIPSLNELASVLQKCLLKNFKEASVTVVNCPDLTKSPFKCASAGLGGHNAVADVGGVKNMEFLANNNKYHWDLNELSRVVGLPFWIGCAATKPALAALKDNSELMPNVNTSSKLYLSKEAYTGKDGNGYVVDYPYSEFSSLGNFFVSEGKPGSVLKVQAKNRTGKLNIVTCMRQGLAEYYGNDKQVGLGGVLLIQKGKIKSHIMPGFPPCDVFDNPKIEWLKFYEVPAPLTCWSVFVTHDKYNDELRLEHTHFTSWNGKDGGHYHYDTTPEEVVYEGYYNVAAELFRIGKAVFPANQSTSKL